MIKTSARQEAKLKNQAPSLQLTNQQMSRLTLGQYQYLPQHLRDDVQKLVNANS